MKTRPIIFPGQQMVNLLVLGSALAVVVFLLFNPTQSHLFPLLIALRWCWPYSS